MSNCNQLEESYEASAKRRKVDGVASNEAGNACSVKELTVLDLPMDVLEQILGYLSPTQLNIAAKVPHNCTTAAKLRGKHYTHIHARTARAGVHGTRTPAQS